MVVFFHVLNASLAAAIAALVSSTPWSATSPIALPVAGSVTENVLLLPTHSPLM